MFYAVMIDIIQFISISYMSQDLSLNGILSFCRVLWTRVHLILSLVRDINHINNHFILFQVDIIKICVKFLREQKRLVVIRKTL